MALSILTNSFDLTVELCNVAPLVGQFADLMFEHACSCNLLTLLNRVYTFCAASELADVIFGRSGAKEDKRRKQRVQFVKQLLDDRTNS